MNRAEQIARHLDQLPTVLKRILDYELAAGNALIEAEIGTGTRQGNVALILEKAFQTGDQSASDGVIYREMEAADRRIFEFTTADERYSLVHVKFAPMKLPKLGDGPPNPTEAHIAIMQKIAQREEAAAKARLPKPRPASPTVKASVIADPASRFMASMKMNFDMWHDGTGYDLEAIAQLPSAELQLIEAALIRHQPRDWRDIEALARIDSPTARSAIEAALTHSDPHVRNEAMKHVGLKASDAEREAALVKNLETANLLGGLGAAIDEAAEFHPPGVIDALFHGALHRDGEAAVHFAATLFYVHGKAREPFDWDHRPFFLRFNTTDRTEREAVFVELCKTVGVDPERWLLSGR